MTGMQAVSVPTDWPAILTALAAFVGAMATAFVLVWKTVVKPKIDGIETKVDEGIVIGKETRKMADGRLTAVTEQLAESKTEVARLVNEGVMTAAGEILKKAEAASEAMTAKAAAAALELLTLARKDAAALLEEAAEAAPRKRRS